MRYRQYTLIFTFFVYLLGILIGIYWILNTSDAELSVWRENTKVIIDKFTAKNKYDILYEIIKNNLTVVFFNLTGIFSFGIISIICVFFNGLTFGQLIVNAYQIFSFKGILYYVLPHSIEVIAIILSGYLGMIGGFDMLNYINNQNHKIDYFHYIKLLLLSITLVIIAGFLEVFVSMSL